MQVLVGRERAIFGALAAALLDRPAFRSDALAERVRAILASASPALRLLFRAALFLLEWGTLFLRTGSGRFEHFSRLPWRARRRYVRLWMSHRLAPARQLFFFLKLLVLAATYDERAAARRVGYAPRRLP
jgi:hypothetical protein